MRKTICNALVKDKMQPVKIVRLFLQLRGDNNVRSESLSEFKLHKSRV